MPDPRDLKLANVLVHYSAEVVPGDRVALFGSPLAEPLLRALYREILRAGGHPYPFIGYDIYPSYGGFDDIFFREASEAQLTHVYETERMVKTEFEAMVIVRSKRNTNNLSGVDPSRQRLRHQAYEEINRSQFVRGASREFKWVVTVYPTQAQAQEAGLSRAEFADFVYRACYLDAEDPVAAWRKLREEQQVLVEWLAGKKEIAIKGANADLTFSIDGRTFINSDGKNNMPSGEIFTGPVEDSVDGWVRFTYPAFKYGILVEGVELRFEGGKVVEASAKANEEFLLEQLGADEGARRLGEWALGTNDRIKRYTKNILFDEKIGGTMHMALGRGFPQTGSVNQSAIHWDMITDMKEDGEIWVDGELFYRRGRFQP